MNVTDHCLYNLVGIEHCSQPESVSGMYINDLAGMYTELAQKIAIGEEGTFKNVFDKVQKRSFVRLEEDIVHELSEFVKFNEIICQTNRLQPTYGQLTNIPASNQYRGVYVQMPQSKYSELRIHTLYFYNNGATVTTFLKGYDLNDGKEILSRSITLQSGLNEIEVNETFNLRYKIFEAFFGVDCSQIDTIQTEESFYGWYDSDLQCVYCTNYYAGRTGIFMYNAATLETAQPVNIYTVQRSGLGFGVGFKMDICCSAYQYLCENKARFANALTYLEASEMLKQKLASPNVNVFTVSNPEGTAFLKDEFESEYKKALTRAIESIPLNGEGECFNCESKENITYGGIMP
jgi:hypothetical protein